jgi:hypothetical protein
MTVSFLLFLLAMSVVGNVYQFLERNVWREALRRVTQENQDLLRELLLDQPPDPQADRCCGLPVTADGRCRVSGEQLHGFAESAKAASKPA